MQTQEDKKPSLKAIARKTSTGYVLDLAVSRDYKVGKHVTVPITVEALRTQIADFHGVDAIINGLTENGEADIYAMSPKSTLIANHIKLLEAAPEGDVSRFYRFPSISESRQAGALKMLKQLKEAGAITPEAYLAQLEKMVR